MDTRIRKRGRVPSRLRRQEGAAMVEFAIVAPLLLVLLFGIIEFGCILYDKAVITNMSREGARYAAMYYIDQNGNPAQHTCSDVQNYVTNVVQPVFINLGNTSASCTVTCPYVDLNQTGVGYMTQVQVSYPYTFLVFGSLITLINGSITNPMSLTATTAMRLDGQF